MLHTAGYYIHTVSSRADPDCRLTRFAPNQFPWPVVLRARHFGPADNKVMTIITITIIIIICINRFPGTGRAHTRVFHPLRQYTTVYIFIPYTYTVLGALLVCINSQHGTPVMRTEFLMGVRVNNDIRNVQLRRHCVRAQSRTDRRSCARPRIFLLLLYDGKHVHYVVYDSGRA